MSQLSQEERPRVPRSAMCPAFDCKSNKDFQCFPSRGDHHPDSEVRVSSVSEPIEPTCMIESSHALSTKGTFTLSKDGNRYLFLSYVPGQGLLTGIFEGQGKEIYAVKYKPGQLEKVDFYYDKVLKYIPKNQLVLPGFEIGERITIHE